MKKLLSAIISLFLLSGIVQSAFAQGIIGGSVTDSLSHEALVGASLYLKGTALGASSDIEGHYRISNIPFGNYEMRVMYIGYKSKTIPVEVRSTKPIVLNVTLTGGTVAGKEVIVTAQAQGQAAAINQQLTSDQIVNVVSAQKIQELPDANVAEALGRLPGVSLIRSGGEASEVEIRGMAPQFASVTIDGIRVASTNQNDRGVDLSTISQQSLAGMELYNTLLPDQDADAIAGSINLVTKKAPSERMIRIQTIGTYNNLDKSLGQFNLQGQYGQRFFNDVLGLQVAANLQRVDRSEEGMNITWEGAGGSVSNVIATDFKVNHTGEIRRRSGGNVILDVNTPDSGSIKLNTFYGETTRSYLTAQRDYALNGYGIVGYNYNDVHSNINILTAALQGDNNLFGFHENWDVSFAQSGTKTPLNYSAIFDEVSTLDSNGVPLSGMRPIPVQYQQGPFTAWVPYAINNFNVASLTSADNDMQSNLEKQKVAYLNLSKSYRIGDEFSGTFKFGGKYRETDRTDANYQSRALYSYYPVPNYVKLPDGSVVHVNYTGTPFQNLKTVNGMVTLINFLDNPPTSFNVYGEYPMYPIVDRNYLEAWRSISLNGYLDQAGKNPEYVVNPSIGGAGDNYNILERISAGYLMNTLNWGRTMTFIAGVRIAQETDHYGSMYSPIPLGGFPFPQGVLRDTTVGYSTTTILPNFHVIYRPFDFLNIRAAAYKALARPQFNYRILKFIANPGDLYVGNPNLKNAIAWNYEVGTQLYGGYFGLFTIDAYYKSISNMFHYVDGVQIPAGQAGQLVMDSLGIGWKNPYPSTNIFNLHFPYTSTKPTTVWGFEVEHQVNFRWLPGLLQNIVLDYNFTFARSKTWTLSSKIVVDTVTIGPVKVPESHSEMVNVSGPLETQPEFFGNLELGYDLGGFSFRIAGFYQGSYVLAYGLYGDKTIQDAYTRVDVSLKQRLGDNISVLLNLNNITDTQEGVSSYNHILNRTIPDSNYRYGMTADLGLRLDF